MNKIGKWILLLLSGVGFFLVGWLWPNEEILPSLKHVEPFVVEEVVSEQIYKFDNEKVKLVAFYFTYCPDICPTTMVDLAQLQVRLEENDLLGNKVELVSITLDPTNDTEEVIQNYAEIFQSNPSGWKWLRGSEEETRKIASAFQMQYQIQDGKVIAHSVNMYLLDKENMIRAIYTMANVEKPMNLEGIIRDMELLSSEFK
ncbi:SCO family protein [Bacillus alkalisoli]|uniref:SCO family protein n=1 Tax=Bacillus alkalisoli TaxID=2011008 RepID=UPI000C24A64D|nr:SCO family protein [Bacillus alkalisoli]